MYTIRRGAVDRWIRGRTLGATTLAGVRVTAEEIRGLRRALDLTQMEMARRVGTTLTTISRWETGKARPRGLYLRELERLAAEDRNGSEPRRSIASAT